MNYHTEEDLKNPNEIEMFLLEHLDFKHGTYIEAGANDGIRDSISYFFEKTRRWSGILVEPVQEMMSRCVKNRDGELNFFFEGGLGEKNGKISIKIPLDNLDNSSMNMSPRHLKLLRSTGFLKKPVEERTVQMLTYDTVLTMADVDKIDLAIFDVEGFENVVLRGVMRSSAKPKIMVVEKDWSDRDELISLTSSAYDLIKEFKSDMVFKRREK